MPGLEDMTKEQLIAEIRALKKQVAELEGAGPEREKVDETGIFKKFAQNSGQGFGMADLEGNVIYVNPALCKMFGEEKPEDSYRKNIGDYYSEESYKRFKEKVAPVLMDKGQWTGESTLVSAKGKAFFVIENIFIIYDEKGDPFYYANVLTDITERKEAEKELLANETRLKELFNNMSSAVAVYEAASGGEDFIFKDFNRHGEKIDNAKRDDIIGRPVTECFPGVKEFGLFEVFQRVYRTGVSEHFSAKLYKDGRISGWRNNYVYKLPTGEVVAIYDDVTEKIKAEEELKETVEELQSFKEVTVDREEKMIELKKEINKLYSEKGKKEPYDISFAE